MKAKRYKRLFLRIKTPNKNSKVFCIRPVSVNSRQSTISSNIFNQNQHTSRSRRQSFKVNKTDFSIPESQFEDDDQETMENQANSLIVPDVTLNH